MAQEKVSQERLMSLLHYNPDSGKLTWLVAQSQRNHVGDIAGHVRADGYREIQIDRQRYMAHRLIWFYVHGVWPILQLDHCNGCRDDNRISNLRPAAQAQNCWNSVLSKASIDGRGVSRRKGYDKWQVKIRVNGRRLYLGMFDSAEDAARVYETAASQMHGEYRRK